jgi:hypothetical protein
MTLKQETLMAESLPIHLLISFRMVGYALFVVRQRKILKNFRNWVLNYPAAIVIGE